MTIAWIYLDKRAAAIDALKDFNSMKWIISNYRKSVAEVRGQMTAVPVSGISATPMMKKPEAGEEWLAGNIDEIDVLRERYRQALEFMEWFRPAWDKMTEDEQYSLLEFYLRDEYHSADAITNISKHFGIERSSAYKKKDRALAKLAHFLYGK